MDDIADSIAGLNRSEKAIPRNGALSHADEQAFRAFMAFDPNVREYNKQFSNKYGEQPDYGVDDFNYRDAYMQGNRPEPYAHDNSMHWDSRGKQPNHPTAWMQDYFEKYAGADPNDASTPDQIAMISDNAKRQMLDAMMQRLLHNK